MECKFCKKEFEQKKSFHYMCFDCLSKACKCVNCNKTIFPNKKGQYECCGESETSDEIQYKADFNRRQRARFVNRIFDGVNSHWNEESGEFDDYEGLPNT